MASQIAEQILRYLAKHPDAGDTVEGIVQWWLLEQRIENQLAETRRELQRLVKLDLVQEMADAKGRRHYRLNKEKQSRIQEILSRTNTKQN